jgi:hypothetical protein
MLENTHETGTFESERNNASERIAENVHGHVFKNERNTVFNLHPQNTRILFDFLFKKQLKS